MSGCGGCGSGYGGGGGSSPPPPAPLFALLTIEVPISGAGGDATFDSVATTPAGSRVYLAQMDNSVGFSGGVPAISIGTPALPSAYMTTADNDPTITDTQQKAQRTVVAAPAVVRVTVTGVPTAGTGVVTIFYATPAV